MKKKITMTITLIFILPIIICIVSIKKEKDKSLKNISINDQNLTFIFETDKGNVTGSSEDWLSDEYKDYELDIEKSECNGQTNPSGLSWDNGAHSISLDINGKSNKCTLYFHLGSKSLGDSIKDLVGAGNEVASGNGYLYYHDSNLTNGARDNGYRYAGDEPNNYICFGNGSEGYNSGSSENCPLTNKYRIIGLVPVTTSDNKSEMLVKIIKAEYITATELGISSTGTVSSNSSYTSLKRIEGSNTSVPGFHWNDTSNNTWSTSTLYSALNNESSGYLNFLYGTNKTTWENKIETVKWNVGGCNTNQVTPQAAYTAEMTNGSGTAGADTTKDAKVGLMYVHDYGFASKKDNWTSTLNNYDNNNNRQANWLFNEVYEWTISRHSSYSGIAFYVHNTGAVSYGNVIELSYGVRPVLYLTSDVKLGGGEGIDGSQSKPYKVR